MLVSRNFMALNGMPPLPYKFSICTLVRNPDKYSAMVESFVSAGFKEDVEYKSIDNSLSNQYSAYAGLNLMLRAATGQYVILCHEDVRLIHDDRFVLEARLAELTEADPSWGLAGNAGAMISGEIAIRITDLNNDNSSIGRFPARVVSLDENFIVVRGGLCFGFSGDLVGFHLYGLDICLHARLSGYSCYVINFHLLHEGKGELGEAFFHCLENFERKWSQHLRPELVFTTCTLVAFAETETRRRMMKASYGKNHLHQSLFAIIPDAVRPNKRPCGVVVLKKLSQRIKRWFFC